MHENVKPFTIVGEIHYKFLTSARETLERSVEDRMRDQGYVPVLDMDPQLTQTYDDKTGNFKITMSIYGAYVGDKAWATAGLMGGKPIMKYIPKDKSSQSLPA